MFFRNQILAWGMAKTGLGKKEAILKKDIKNKFNYEKIQKLRAKVTKEYFTPLDDDSVLVKKLPLILGRYDEHTNDESQPTFPIHQNYALSVSRRHAILYEEKGKIKIRDLGSKKGTHLRKRGVKPHIEIPYELVSKEGEELKNNDVIYLGDPVIESFYIEFEFEPPSIWQNSIRWIKNKFL